MSDQNREKILEKIRDNSKKEGTMENFLYSLLSVADDDFKKGYENLLVNAYAAAEQTAQVIIESDNDPALKSKLEEKLTSLVSSVYDPSDEDEKSDS